VAPGVFLDPFARIDHQECRFGAGGAAHHVLKELDVPRRVDDHIRPAAGVKEHPRRVDGDSLRPLVLERVEQKGILERPRGPDAQVSNLLQLSFRQGSRVRQQSANDGALAMVHMTHDDEG
jgi:hypothetical protein